MKKYIFGMMAALTLASGAFTACDLDEYDPSAVSLDERLSTPEGIEGMQALCYQPLYAQLYSVFDFMQVTELGTDIWWTDRNKTNTEQMFFYEGLTPSTGKGWDKSFTQLYSAMGLINTIIDKGEVLVSDSIVQHRVAEAYFLRAFYYLQLTTYYGPITLNTNTPLKVTSFKPKRNTLSEIYAQIISDLKYAEKYLPLTQSNRARVTKKAAKGMLCRAYAQGAGQGLTENGKSYWERAKEESEDFIAHMADYGAYLYDDVSNLWSDSNNRNNKESLFFAAGQDATSDDNLYNYSSSFTNKLFTYCYCNQEEVKEISLIESAKSDPLYGRTNNSLMAPSEYLLHCFNPAWDQRWEYSFQTAYFTYSQQLVPGGRSFNDSRVIWAETPEGERQVSMDKYGISFTDDAVPHRVVPYVDLGKVIYQGGGAQYPARVWPKGRAAIGSALTKDEINDMLTSVKKIYANPYPLDADDNRFYLYLYPEWDTQNYSTYDRSDRVYCSVKIGNLFYDDPAGYRRYVMNQAEFKENVPYISKETNIFTERPSLNKFMWNYEGVYYGSNLQIRNGDVAIQRMAEIYLIAAEAEQKLGNEAAAAQYLNVLRKRAARPEAQPADYELATASEDDVLDEFARELCGEFQRWAILQRHGVLADRLQKYNGRAAKSFQPYMQWRPMSASFLQQIENADEYGDNGYGTTPTSGLEGYLK